jgi:hypothetical protein
MHSNAREDLKELYLVDTTNEEGVVTGNEEFRVPTMFIRNVELLQIWYQSKRIADIRLFFTLTDAEFRAWKNLYVSNNYETAASTPDRATASPYVFLDGPTTPSNTTIPAPSDAVQFQRSIKRSPTDYTKFKDDARWKQWHRHLKATANSHGLQNVLSTTYIPSTPDEVALFDVQKTFMYSVFEQCLNTPKSRHVVQTHEATANAQAVYCELLKVYEENLSMSLLATDLRTELTLLRYNDSWKKSSEAFLQHWQGRILELEQLEDKAIDNDTKRLWLTATLSSKPHMASCVTQAKVTEMTMLGMGNTSASTIPWDNFYNLVLAHAKLHDHSSPTKPTRETNNNERSQGGRGDGRGRVRAGRNPGRGGGRYSGRTPRTDLIFTTVTGPDMVMKANMKFHPDEYAKLTAEQKVKLRVSKGLPPQPAHRAANVTTVQPTAPPAPVLANAEAPDTHLRTLLSNRHARTAGTDDQVTVNGCTYQRVINVVNVSFYSMYNAQWDTPVFGSLLDGGANGGMSGNDVRIIETTLNHADVSGLNNHSVSNLPIVTVAGVLSSAQGLIVGIFHQYAHLGKGKTIHSTLQLRSFGIDICDNPLKFGGKQRVQHPDGYNIPINIRNGLPYMDMYPPSDEELESLPHVIFTADECWDPTSNDNEYHLDKIEFEEDDFVPCFGHNIIDRQGNVVFHECLHHMVAPHNDITDASFYDYVDATVINVHHNHVSQKQHNFDRLKPNFGFVPSKRIQKTIENTTQFCRMDARLPLRKHFKSRFPAANVPRRNEIVATDTFFSDVPAHDDGILGHGGATMVQLYCGTTSLITAIFPMKSESEMPGTLQDFIRKLGAPNGLFSDNAKVQIGKAVQTILRMYCIDDMQSEPHHQHQNPAERRIQDVKKVSNSIMDRTGTPESF